MNRDIASHYYGRPLRRGAVLPLIATASEGGPYDDESFVAGWELGELFAVLQEIRPQEIERHVRTASLPQLDLLLEHHGYQHKAARDVDGWSWVRIWRSR